MALAFLEIEAKIGGINRRKTMNIKFLMVILAALLGWSYQAQAEDAPSAPEAIASEAAAVEQTIVLTEDGDEIVEIREEIADEVPDLPKVDEYPVEVVEEAEAVAVAPAEEASEAAVAAVEEVAVVAEDAKPEEELKEETPAENVETTESESAKTEATAEPATDEAVVVEESAEVVEVQEEAVPEEEVEQDLSQYIEALGLDMEQMEKAKEISRASRIKQEQIMHSIELLRQEARDLEIQSIDDLAGILTPEQRDNLMELIKKHVAARKARKAE